MNDADLIIARRIAVEKYRKLHGKGPTKVQAYPQHTFVKFEFDDDITRFVFITKDDVDDHNTTTSGK